jgi:hypothetical protein
MALATTHGGKSLFPDDDTMEGMVWPLANVTEVTRVFHGLSAPAATE